LAAEGSVPLENPRAVQQKVNRDGDHHSQAVLERHGSRTGTVLASNPGPTSFRSGALPVKRLELVSVYGKRRLCGNRSPESALAILQKSPPDVVWTHDQTHATASNCGPFDSTNFMERHSLKAQ
jgi:hypothetical protein